MEELLKVQCNLHTEARDVSTASLLLQVVDDNATRWNSTCNMVYRALQVKDAVDLSTTRHVRSKRKDNKNLRKNQLTQEDWDALARILLLLEPFKKLTSRMESRAMEWVIEHTGYLWGKLARELPALRELYASRTRRIMLSYTLLLVPVLDSGASQSNCIEGHCPWPKTDF